MIRLTLLPFQQHQQQQKQSHHRHHQHSHREQRSTLHHHITVFVGFLLLFCISSSSLVFAEGPHCNQVGHGPSDIIMATGRINPKYTWYKRGHKTYVPVVLDPTYSQKERSIIVGGLNEIQEKTCVEFDFYDYEHSLHGKDYVYITRTTKRGCWSYIGRIGRGKQEMGLPPGCITHRTAMHEMMHALGFRHEHVRSDRDDYIMIFWGNIRQGRESNFQKRSNDLSVGPYDYDSIMHYDRKAFSKNGMDTIRPLKSGVKIGVRQKMSHWDAKKINIMYGCHPGGGGGGHLSWSPEHSDHEDFHLIDATLSLPRNASSSPPSSAEIEVAYDELDYDPGITPSAGSGPRRYRGGGRYSYGDNDDRRSFYPRDEYHHSGPPSRHPHIEGGDYHHNHPHHHDDSRRPGYQRGRNHPHDHPGPNSFEDDETDHHGRGYQFGPNEHSQGHGHGRPRSYSHFDLDTYPDDRDGPRGEERGSSNDNDDFYDF